MQVVVKCFTLCDFLGCCSGWKCRPCGRLVIKTSGYSMQFGKIPPWNLVKPLHLRNCHVLSCRIKEAKLCLLSHIQLTRFLITSFWLVWGVLDHPNLPLWEEGKQQRLIPFNAPGSVDATCPSSSVPYNVRAFMFFQGYRQSEPRNLSQTSSHPQLSKLCVVFLCISDTLRFFVCDSQGKSS